MLVALIATYLIKTVIKIKSFIFETVKVLKTHLFHSQAIWPKLCTDQQEAKAYKASEAQLKHLEDLLAEGCAALPLLEAQLCNAACSDVGGVIMDEVLLPLLRQRLTTLADDFCAGHPQVTLSLPLLPDSVSASISTGAKPIVFIHMCLAHMLLIAVE